MRLFVYILSVCFSLLANANIAYADASNTTDCYISAENCIQDKQIKFSNHDQSLVLIEDIVDIEEESLNCTLLKYGNNTKSLISKNSFLKVCHVTLTSQIVLNDYYKRFKNLPPFSGSSTPIFIINRVIRI